MITCDTHSQSAPVRTRRQRLSRTFTTFAKEADYRRRANFGDRKKSNRGFGDGARQRVQGLVPLDPVVPEPSSSDDHGCKLLPGLFVHLPTTRWAPGRDPLPPLILVYGYSSKRPTELERCHRPSSLHSALSFKERRAPVPVVALRTRARWRTERPACSPISFIEFSRLHSEQEKGRISVVAPPPPPS